MSCASLVLASLCKIHMTVSCMFLHLETVRLLYTLWGQIQQWNFNTYPCSSYILLESFQVYYTLCAFSPSKCMSLALQRWLACKANVIAGNMPDTLSLSPWPVAKQPGLRPSLHNHFSP